MNMARLSTKAPRWQIGVITILLSLGSVRAGILLLHDPLLAYANSYDQTRYTACFDLYPERAAAIAPTLNSPAAPFSNYVFIGTNDPLCYWSSDLIFQASSVAIYRWVELGEGHVAHSVRVIGVLRLLALLVVCLLLSRAWLQRDRSWLAIANAALLPLLFTDPANVLYLNTFYAEWTALLALYACISLILLYCESRRSSKRCWWLLLTALLLATSKIQHIFLPLALTLVAMVMGRLHGARWWRWQNVALLLGALGGLYFQFVQLQRDGEMMQTIRQYNSADVLLTALLPASSDPVAAAAQLQIDPSCLQYIGNAAWQLPDLPNHACPGLINFTRGRELALLAQQPLTLLRIWWRGVQNLSPWMADNIGHVEGAKFAKLPSHWLSISRLLAGSRILLVGMFLLPSAVLLLMLLYRRWRNYSQFLLFTALIAVTQQTTLLITVLGDGLADTAKQGGLAVNAGIAWLLVSAILLMARIAAQRTPSTPSISTSNSARQTSP
jgi:hypothetical protein